MWNAYWAGEVLNRPLVVAEVAAPGARPRVDARRYYHAVTGQYGKQLAAIDEWLARTAFPAETMPCFAPDFGPDQFAAWLGAELRLSEQSPTTSWVRPSVEDWADAFPLELDESGAAWRRVLEYSRVLAEHAAGRYLVALCDLHSNADALSALRGPERLCMDFYDSPSLIEQAMREVRHIYPRVYQALYDAGGMSRETGSISWIPFWCEGRFGAVQCDFLCMISPELSRRYVLPAIEEEAASLDHCVFHLDGPGALVHLDDLLSIEDIDVIQWVPGAGQPPPHEWVDVLKKCQQAGKGLEIDGQTAETIKRLHGELDPRGVVYCMNVRSVEEVEDTLKWLARNT